MLFEDKKKLGFGCLRLPHIDPNDTSDVDIDEMRRMVDAFIAAGFKYFDTAYSYLNYKSECFVKEAISSRYPRESFVLTTKLPCLELKEDSVPRAYFQEQLDKCGVEYFDFYFLHSLNEHYYRLAERLGCFELLKELKSNGKAKNIGFSFHDSADVLDMILSQHPEIDVVQIQLNYLDWENPVIQSKRCYDVCQKHNKPVIVMEPVKGGTLAKLPAQAQKLMEDYAPGASPSSWAIRFAASQPGVAMVLSGMSNMEQVRDNISYMADFKPLNEQEKAILQKCAQIVKQSVAIPCTACAYCTDGCPVGIPIPRYFALFNENKRDGWQAGAKKRYGQMTMTHAAASQCIHCGQCQAKCPQHIDIIDWLEKTAEQFE